MDNNISCDVFVERELRLGLSIEKWYLDIDS